RVDRDVPLLAADVEVDRGTVGRRERSPHLGCEGVLLPARQFPAQLLLPGGDLLGQPHLSGPHLGALDLTGGQAVVEVSVNDPAHQRGRGDGTHALLTVLAVTDALDDIVGGVADDIVEMLHRPAAPAQFGGIFLDPLEHLVLVWLRWPVSPVFCFLTFGEAPDPACVFMPAPAPVRPRLVMVLIRPSHSSRTHEGKWAGPHGPVMSRGLAACGRAGRSWPRC